MTAPSPLILLHPDDTVLVLRRDLAEGEPLAIDGQALAAPAAAPLGHKLARRALAAGEAVVKYGARIGTMTAAAAAGEHVHLHNMASDYIPAHSRQAAGGEDEGR